jgi:hypothetical protein
MFATAALAAETGSHTLIARKNAKSGKILKDESKPEVYSR